MLLCRANCFEESRAKLIEITKIKPKPKQPKPQTNKKTQHQTWNCLGKNNLEKKEISGQTSAVHQADGNYA